MASTDLLRSRQAQAVSVNDWNRPHHDGVGHSAGHPDHGDGTTVDRGGGVPSEMSRTPSGSPGVAGGGPTVPGGCVAGSLALGTTPSSIRNAARSSVTATVPGVEDRPVDVVEVVVGVVELSEPVPYDVFPLLGHNGREH